MDFTNYIFCLKDVTNWFLQNNGDKTEIYFTNVYLLLLFRFGQLLSLVERERSNTFNKFNSKFNFLHNHASMHHPCTAPCTDPCTAQLAPNPNPAPVSSYPFGIHYTAADKTMTLRLSWKKLCLTLYFNLFYNFVWLGIFRK